MQAHETRREHSSWPAELALKQEGWKQRKERRTH